MQSALNITDYKYATDFIMLWEQFIKENSSNTLPIKNELSQTVSRLFHELKLPVHFPGYHYLKSAIIMTVLRESKLPDISSRLYQKVAEEFGTNQRHVERAILKAVKHINTSSCKDYIIRTILNYDVDSDNYTLNAKELIALIADQLRLSYTSFND